MIERALDALPEHFRSAVVLVDIEDQSYEAAAAVLHVPLGTECGTRVEAPYPPHPRRARVPP